MHIVRDVRLAPSEQNGLRRVKREMRKDKRRGLIDYILRNAGDGVPYGVLFQRFVGNTVLGVPILNPSVFLQAKSHLPLTREA